MGTGSNAILKGWLIYNLSMGTKCKGNDVTAIHIRDFEYLHCLNV